MFKKIVLGVILTAMAGSVSAQALTAKQTVEREVVVNNEDGTQSVKREPADKVIPGETIIYTLDYFNDKTEAAEQLVFTMPVPKEVIYKEGSVEAQGAKTVYSADGGKTFAPRETLSVKGADGKMRPAKAEDITHIRWTVAGPVAANTGGKLVYAGKLK